jgi:hypothetical protein
MESGIDREQVIKGAEMCFGGGDCEQCPYNNHINDCWQFLEQDILAIIHEFSEENERLTSLCASKDVIIGGESKR